MGARTRSALWVGAVAVLLVATFGQLGATGVTNGRINLAAVGFAWRTSTDGPPFGGCGSIGDGAWQGGALYNGSGLFIEPVALPNGATVTGLTYAVRDFSGDQNSSARLVRKDVSAGTDAFGGRYVMAAAVSAGGDEEVRRFEDATIGGGLVNTDRYAYIAVITNCDPTIQPISVIVDYTLP